MRFRAGPIKPTTISFLEVCTFEVGVGVLLTSSHFTFRPLSLVGGPDSPLVTIDRQRDRIKENGNMIFFKKKIQYSSYSMTREELLVVAREPMVFKVFSGVL